MFDPRKVFTSLLLMTIVAVGAASTAEAATITITRHDYASGSSRFASANGYISLMPGEVVTDVRCFTNNIHGPTGSAQGTYAPSTGYWSVTDGAFDLYSYYVQIQTNYYGHKLTYTSPLYYWGH